MGCKDPNLECGGIDCSGLVSSCYAFAGVNSVVGKDANGQYNAARETDYPFYGDLVFWRGTYNRFDDCRIDEGDEVTHVGIVMPFGWMIHASGRAQRVILFRISSMPSNVDEETATKITCDKPDKGQEADPEHNYCPNIKGCTYDWKPTGRKFESFMGYRYAREFDEECPKKKKTCESVPYFFIIIYLMNLMSGKRLQQVAKILKMRKGQMLIMNIAQISRIGRKFISFANYRYIRDSMLVSRGENYETS